MNDRARDVLAAQGHIPVGGQLAPSCCLLILNYNGRELLEECLPSAIEASSRYPAPSKVVVVDNCSTEDDVAFVERSFPQVEVVVTRKNDYLFSLNQAVYDRPEEIAIILNNDMTFEPDFIAPLVRHFGDPEVFAASAKVYYWDRETVLTAESELVRGRFWHSLRRTSAASRARYTLYAAGGAAAFRRRMFDQLGGFDPLFRPAYYEEVDLSYRAWRRGWKVIYEPRSAMFHRRSATLEKQHSKERWKRIILRNQVLFNLKDAGGALHLLGFLALLAPRFARAAVTGERSRAAALLMSLPRVPRALYGRLRSSFAAKRSERWMVDQIERGGLLADDP